MDKGIYVASTYDALTTACTFKVYNSADEQIEGVSVSLDSVKFSGGIIVPYGGYLEITVKSGYYIDVRYQNYTIWRLQNGYPYKIKIVDNMIMIATRLTEQTNAPT